MCLWCSIITHTRSFFFFFFQSRKWLAALATFSLVNRRCRISAFSHCGFFENCSQLKGEKNDIPFFKCKRLHLSREWDRAARGIALSHQSSRATFNVLTHSSDSRPTRPCLFFFYHCSLISSQNTSSMSVEGGASGKQGVVISMDPFLYDSWHSLPLGKGQISGGRRWFPLLPLPPPVPP